MDGCEWKYKFVVKRQLGLLFVFNDIFVNNNQWNAPCLLPKNDPSFHYPFSVHPITHFREAEIYLPVLIVFREAVYLTTKYLTLVSGKKNFANFVQKAPSYPLRRLFLHQS